MAESSGATPAEPTDREPGCASVLSWDTFELRLAAYLSTMVDPREGDHLVLEVPGTCEADGCAPYVQFAGFDCGRMIRAEVSGNHYLAPAHRLTAQQLTGLAEVGWELGSEREPNHYLACDVPDAELVAAASVAVLRDYFHLPTPELLTARTFGPAAAGDSILGLPDSDDVPADIVDLVPTTEPLEMSYPENRAQLLECIREVLRDKLSGEPHIDDDGDFVLTCLGQPVWVRACEGAPVVEIFARVVDDVRSRRQTAVELGLLNRDYLLPKWTLRERSVWQTMVVPGQPFVPEQLADALADFCTVMGKTRDDLVLRTGRRAD